MHTELFIDEPHTSSSGSGVENLLILSQAAPEFCVTEKDLAIQSARDFFEQVEREMCSKIPENYDRIRWETTVAILCNTHASEWVRDIENNGYTLEQVRASLPDNSKYFEENIKNLIEIYNLIIQQNGRWTLPRLS